MAMQLFYISTRMLSWECISLPSIFFTDWPVSCTAGCITKTQRIN